MIVLPGEVFDDHRVGTFITETSSGLHEVEILVVALVVEQMVLMLQVHIFQFDVNGLDAF